MLQQATEIYIWVSLSIFCTLACLAECGGCSVDGVHKIVEYNACSSIKNSCNGLQNTYASYFGLDYGSGNQNKAPLTENECSSYELFFLGSTLSSFQSKQQCSRTAESDVDRSKMEPQLPEGSTRQNSNVSMSSGMFHSSVGNQGTLSCSLNFRQVGHEKSPPNVNSADQIVLSSCRGHLLYKRYTSFSSLNIEIEKSPYSDYFSPCLNITPSKLDWGQNYLYHTSVAFIRLKNICDGSALKVYEPLSTDSQFYPFNFSEVVLGPSEVTSISFVFLPKMLGASSAELVLQTSLGGFLVQAKGIAVESPHRLWPLVGFDVSSGGWLSRKLSLTNPFNETIHLEEITASVSVLGSSGSLLAEAICKKQNPQDSDKNNFSDAKMVSNDKSDYVVMAIKPLTDWLISPRKTESILELHFSPKSEGKVLGAICMQLVRPLEGEKDTVVIPFEAEVNNTTIWKDTYPPLSVSIEPVGRCNNSETIVSVSVRNRASHLLKILRITEVVESKKRLKIKYLEGLLLFPGAVTQVALVTYESSDVNYDSVLEMPDVSMSCRLQILANYSIGSHLEVPCQEIFAICPRRQLEVATYRPDGADVSNRTGSPTSTVKLPVVTEVLEDAEVEEFVLHKWRSQETMSGLYVLDDHVLLFPMVSLYKCFAKSITIKNPSAQPIIVQLLLNSGEVVDNCKSHYSNLQPTLSSNIVDNDSTSLSRYGFSIVDNAVTEAFVHPYGMALVGPIIFHPSNRCEWKSSALVRNNLSGVEEISLQGFGGSLSLVLVEGSEFMHRLLFSMNLPFALNMSHPVSPSNVEDPSSGCRTPLLKKLFAVNAGDFPVKVERIDVSGAACGLDGFIVHDCKGFALLPGESVELGISYQAEFSGPLVQRDLEFTWTAGRLVIPMQASIPIDMLTLCRKSIWVRVKRWCIFLVFAASLIYLLFCFVMPQFVPADFVDYLIKGDERSIPVVRPNDKSSLLHPHQGIGKSIRSTKMSHLRSDQRNKAASVFVYSNGQHGDMRRGIIAQHIDLHTEITPSSDATKEMGFSPSLSSKSIEKENGGKFEVVEPASLTVKTRKDKRRRQRKRSAAGSGSATLVEVSSSQSGNSTPSSPLSPLTTHLPTPSRGKSQPHDSSSLFVCDGSGALKANTLNPEKVSPGRPNANFCGDLFSTQRQQFGPRKTESKPVLLTSATFPGTGRCASVLPCPSPSRLAVCPHVRAPGPKFHPQKTVQATYDIWGNHFFRHYFMSEPNGSFAMTSESVEGHSDSFFVTCPHQFLMTNSQPRSVSSSTEEG